MRTFKLYEQKVLSEANIVATIQKVFHNSNIKITTVDKNKKYLQFEYSGTEKSFVNELTQIMEENDWIPQSAEYFPDIKKKISTNQSCYYIFTSNDDEGTVVDFKNKTIEWV